MCVPGAYWPSDLRPQSDFAVVECDYNQGDYPRVHKMPRIYLARGGKRHAGQVIAIQPAARACLLPERRASSAATGI